MADERIPGGLIGEPADVLEELIFRRRSIRQYRQCALPEAWIEAMLRCAHQAPSPSNRQPVRFVRIESDTVRDRLQQALAQGYDGLMERHRAIGGTARLRNRINVYRRYAQVMFSAPYLLALGICRDTMGFGDHLAANGLPVGGAHPTADLDMTVGLALQGLMLKAQALGVGSCVLTAPLAFIGDAAKIMGLNDITIRCFVTLGLPAETPEPPRRLALDAVVQVV